MCYVFQKHSGRLPNAVTSQYERMTRSTYLNTNGIPMYGVQKDALSNCCYHRRILRHRTGPVSLIVNLVALFKFFRLSFWSFERWCGTRLEMEIIRCRWDHGSLTSVELFTCICLCYPTGRDELILGIQGYCGGENLRIEA